MKTIWFDITNVPHVNFLLPIINKYKDDYKFIFSLRDFAETKGLFEKKIHYPYIEVGKHQGGNKLKKVLGVIKRIGDLNRIIPPFDIKISVGGDASSIVAKLRHKPSITFDDNEKAPNWRYAPFSDLAFWPKAINTHKLHKQLFTKKNLYQYNGYKEDMYLADYQPDKDFMKQIPLEHFVVVRPENIKANYVSGNTTIVPQLLAKLKEQNYNVLFLPRYDFDRDYAKGFDNVFIPQGALNGLDVCYYADAVLTGAGTMAREAACLGVPAISFYAGKELLTVDQALIKEGKMAFSRDVDEIMKYLLSMKRTKPNLKRCAIVQKEILDKLDDFLRTTC